MLLDLDDRFIQFYPPTVFQHYNIASNFFFEEEGEKYLRMFFEKVEESGVGVGSSLWSAGTSY